MERLTEWNKDRTHGQLIKGDGYTRLAEYEDTGLTPEEIQEIKADRDYWEHEAKKWCAKLGDQKLLTEKQNISEIRDLLLPKCDKCEYLEVETRVGTVYGEYEIAQRTIDIDCKHSDMCSGLERKLKGGVDHGR